MKKKTKLTLGALALGVAAIGLSSCTASFCSIADKSSVMYAYDVYHVKEKESGKISPFYSYGISTYYDNTSDAIKDPENLPVDLPGFANVQVSYNIASNGAIKSFNASAIQNNLLVNDYTEFWSFMDNHFLDLAINAAKEDGADKYEGDAAYNLDKSTMMVKDIERVLIGDKEHNHKGYGYLKYAGEDYWSNWNNAYDLAIVALGADNVPNHDYVKLWKNTMNNAAARVTSCIATKDGFYGAYGNLENKLEVFMEAKDFNYAWGKGFLEGILIYPISWLIDETTTAFRHNLGGGVAQVFAVLVITFLIRAIMMLFTVSQTTQSAKMSELQPEVAKIQAKYPNANTNKSEQMTMASEMQALYKKYKIHPFMSIVVMIFQFPIFICVWGAMQGSAVLASEAFLGLKLSDSVQSALFNVNGWPNNPGWWTALVLFIVMAGLQALSMLLPQIIQKIKTKKLAKLGKNPNVKAQDNKMKWFTIIMMIMVIFMGFSLASGMVIYWIAGSIWTIAQTLIIELINYLKKNHKNKPKKHKPVQAGANGANIVDVEVIPEQFAAPTGKKKFKKGSNK